MLHGEKTYLFVPGDRPERFQKAMESPADAVIIDLEDAVEEKRKDAAREQIRLFLENNPSSKKPIYVRMNRLSTVWWEEDVQFVREYPELGIMVPKAEGAEEIQTVAMELQASQRIIPLIESAKGVLKAPAIAASSQQVYRLAFGAMDYCLELGIDVTEEETELIYPRSALVVASKAYGLPSPIDTVFVNIHDLEGLRRETNIAKQLGMFAKLCIHPKQIDPVQQELSPAEEEMAWAEAVVSAFEQAKREGKAAIQLDGQMIDEPVYRRAKRVLRER